MAHWFITDSFQSQFLKKESNCIFLAETRYISQDLPSFIYYNATAISSGGVDVDFLWANSPFSPSSYGPGCRSFAIADALFWEKPARTVKMNTRSPGMRQHVILELTSHYFHFDQG